MIEQPVKEGQLYSGNGKDFRVHEVRDGQVWGVLYYTKDRGNLDAETCDYQFIRQPIDVFVQNDAELVDELESVATRPKSGPNGLRMLGEEYEADV